MVGKATPGRRGPREPWLNWGPEKMLIRWSKESQHPVEWNPGPPVEHIEKKERHNVDGHKSGGQNIAVYVWSPTPSHSGTPHNPFRTLAIKWEVNIFLKKSSCVRLYHCVCLFIVSLWCCRWQYNIIITALTWFAWWLSGMILSRT